MPKNILIMKGSHKKNPARMKARENEPENVNLLGAAPDSLNAKERVVWARISGEAIPGVLGQADRMAVELACKLFVKIQENTATGVDYNQMIKLLSQFGMSPADRAKISIPKQKKKNPFDDD